MSTCGREIFPGIWVCKCHCFGAPHVRPLYVDADMLIGRFVSGEHPDQIAFDYQIDRPDATALRDADIQDAIQAALRWGCLSREKRAKLLKGTK